MKKVTRKIGNFLKISITTLMIALCIFALFGNNHAYADDVAEDNVVGAEEAGEANAGMHVVEPPLIPKPDMLPGPSAITDTGDNHERYLITDLIPTLIRGAINLLGGITIIALMYGGIQYLTAFGDDTKHENAKRNITFAIVGLMIALFSYTIVKIVSDVPLSDSNEIQQATVDETHTTTY